MTTDRSGGLTIAEEFLLLALKDEKGTVVSGAGVALVYGLAGALLMELALKDRIAVRDGKLGVVDRSPTGDALLDEVIAALTADGKPCRKASRCLTIVTKKIRKLHHRVADRLVTAGILRREEKRILWVFPSVRYPTVNPLPELALRERLKQAILTGEQRTDRLILLAGLMRACNLVQEVFDKSERKAANRRIRKLTRDEEIGKAVSETVAAVQAAVMAGVTAAVIAASASSH